MYAWNFVYVFISVKHCGDHMIRTLMPHSADKEIKP